MFYKQRFSGLVKFLKKLSNRTKSFSFKVNNTNDLIFLYIAHVGSIHQRIDPLNFSQLADIVPKKETREKYEEQWIHFLEFSHISATD